MKEKLICAVLTRVEGIFDGVQREMLKEILIKELRGLELRPSQPSETETLTKNSGHLSAFLSAKKIEGNSPKTLAYYEHTVSKLLDTLKKPIAEITTNDIRCYLAEYQAKGNLSKVTVDNVRRIFPTFFSYELPL